MLLSLEIILSVNALLILFAGLAVLVIARAALKYRRNIGDVPTQHIWRRSLIRAILFLIILSLAGAAFNLFSI